ncbi:3-phosphoserine/phosphohydroxythreonine transaminase [uncultured Zoogloea sp.]|mgnify:CR=1 FL=1|uniref:3-phosphoserine/phosphohydroxythreonine transaminase n=1 Tax=uncultured Zoogloea sp. TaxID=160237 RepID=UPI00261AA655|nr:3-phosphoserine/phosphohydroxythreonine transaminase [uncultured Zoogloea sp.]
MRIFNFSAGPAVLPTPVLEKARDELLDWHGRGMSIMEMSHRGKDFTGVIESAEADLRTLMGIPSSYKVLFLQGGATQMFAQIPMNLLAGGSADYVVTGSWSKKAIKEAQRVGKARLAGSTEADAFTRLPGAGELSFDPSAAYVHLCTNETIHGVEMFDLPETPAGVPVVADMSSHILSRPMDVSKYGLIYAGAQKNIGPAGLVIVIVREDLLGKAAPTTPTVMDFAVMAENGSMLNTPPTFSIYLAGLIFKHLLAKGGVAAVEAANIAKAKRLYDAIDGSGGFYRNPVAVDCRSRMNVPFTLADGALDAAFLAAAAERRLEGLKGHKSVGGMRASIYNAMSLEGIDALVELMQDFAARRA